MRLCLESNNLITSGLNKQREGFPSPVTIFFCTGFLLQFHGKQTFLF